jgi:hypothetical protein
MTNYSIANLRFWILDLRLLSRPASLRLRSQAKSKIRNLKSKISLQKIRPIALRLIQAGVPAPARNLGMIAVQ